jgi:hypothetical protein
VRIPLVAAIVIATAIAAPAARAAHPQVEGKRCAACHTDPHRGEVGEACERCHGDGQWSPSTYGVAQHATYKLDGRHVATPCSGCHPGRPRVSFAIVSRECLDCHQNPHGTRFAKELVAGGCAACHTTGTWKAWKAPHPATFALDGGHARAACTACHPNQQWKGAPRACEACHDDVHAGQFGRRPCTACHTTGSFRAPFDHSKARYTPAGMHVDLACSRCHPQTTLRSGEQAVAWRLGYATCGSCHVQRHRGVAVDCGTCHDSVGFGNVRGSPQQFDHAATGFALRGRHAAAGCMTCHQRGMRPSTSCEGCHVDVHRGRLTGGCAECHTPQAWTDTQVLQRHRQTRMPLTGKHAEIECVACHRRQAQRTWSDTPVDCVSCHAERYRAAVPNHLGAVPFAQNCSLCHVTYAWRPAIDPTAGLRARGRDHLRFALVGPHRAAPCESCHPDPRRAAAVRCDGCHRAATLRAQHRTTAVSRSTSATACLACHPRGARR